MADDAGAHFIPKKAIEQILVQRKSVLREHRIAALLELFHDPVIQPWIVVIGPRQHHHAEPVLPLQHVKHVTGAASHRVLILVQRFKTFFDGPLVFLFREAQHRLPALQHLPREELAVREVHQRVQVADVVLGEDVDLLGVGRLHGLGRHGDGRTGVPGASSHQR